MKALTSSSCANALIFTVLAGCGRSQTSRNVNATTPSVKSAGGALARSSDESEPVQVALVIRVFQEETEKGVASVVNRIDDTGVSHFLTDVDESGIAKLSRPCAAGDRFEANPRVDTFLGVPPLPCAQTVTFRLYGAQATYALIQVAENAEKSGDFAAAQSKYGLAAERLQVSKPAEAEALNLRAQRSAGKILGVDQPTVVVEGKHTIAPLMAERVRAYQQNRGLPMTGVIDLRTREVLAREGTPAAAK